MSEIELPALPQTPNILGAVGVPDVFTHDQMREYARQAVLAERERLEADALRYRWIREESSVVAASIGGGLGLTTGFKHPKDMRLLDERIDGLRKT